MLVFVVPKLNSSIFVLQGLRYEGSGVSAKNFKYLIHARMLKRRMKN